MAAVDKDHLGTVAFLLKEVSEPNRFTDLFFPHRGSNVRCRNLLCEVRGKKSNGSGDVTIYVALSPHSHRSADSPHPKKTSDHVQRRKPSYSFEWRGILRVKFLALDFQHNTMTNRKSPDCLIRSLGQRRHQQDW